MYAYAYYPSFFTASDFSGIVSFVMPIIKSAIKRVRQQIKRRSRNLQVKRAIHEDTKTLEGAVTKSDTKATAEALQAVISQIDRAVKKGTLHKNTAARRKSQLTKAAFAVTGPAPKGTASKKKAPAKTSLPKKKPVAKPKAPAKKAPAK